MPRAPEITDIEYYADLLASLVVTAARTHDLRLLGETRDAIRDALEEALVLATYGAAEGPIDAARRLYDEALYDEALSTPAELEDGRVRRSKADPGDQPERRAPPARDTDRTSWTNRIFGAFGLLR